MEQKEQAGLNFMEKTKKLIAEKKKEARERAEKSSTDNSRIKKVPKKKAVNKIKKFIYRNSLIPSRYRDKTLNNFKLDNLPQNDIEVYKDIRKYSLNPAEKLKEGKGLIFSGRRGNGKTHLTVGVAKKFIEYFANQEYPRDEKYKYGIISRSSNWTPVYFVNVNRTLLKIQENFDKKPDEKEIKRHWISDKIRSSKLVIFDDIFSENPTDWRLSVVHGWLNDRYDFKKTTLFTTNVDLKNFLKDSEDERLQRMVSRIREMCYPHIYQLKGEDKR